MESIKNLRKICQNKGYQEHISLRFYRIFSIYITKIFLTLKIRPNIVSVLGFLIGIMGGYLYLNSYFLKGSILFLISLILDFVDGEIARYYKLSSNFGAWLDTINAHLLYPYFFFTLGLGIFFQTRIFRYVFLGALAAIVKLIERSVPKIATGDINHYLLKDQSVSSIKIWAGHVGKIIILYPLILFCSVMDWEKWFLLFFTIYLTLFTLGKILLIGCRAHKYEDRYRNTK